MASNKEKLIVVAQKLVEKGQFDKAVKEYLKVVQEDDKDVRIWLKIGDLYVKQSRNKEAADAYQRVAQAYSDQGFYRKAVAVYKQIIKIEPRLIEVAQRLADLCKELGLVADALVHYEQVASFHQREGRTRDALPALKQMVDLEPDNVASRIKLAELYSKEQMPREAVSEFTRAADYLKDHDRIDDFMKVAERLLFHTPDNYGLARELAGLYITRGDPRRALPKLQVCFKHDPRDFETLSLLANAFEALGQRDKTLSVLRELARIQTETNDRRRDETWRRVLRLVPDDPEALAALGMKAAAPEPVRAPEPAAVVVSPSVMTERPQPPQAQRRAVSVAAPVPRGPKTPVAVPAAHAAAMAQAAGGRTASVAAQRPRNPMAPGPSFLEEPSEESTSTDPGSEEEIARILGETEVYRKYGLHAKAVEHLHRVFLHDPYHRGAREKLAALYSHLGRVDEAVTQYWSLYQEVGNTPEGEAWLREILRLRPDSAEVRAMLDEMAAALPPPPVAAPSPSRSVAARLPVALAPEPTPAPEPEPDADADIEELGEDAVEEVADSFVEVAEGTIDAPLSWNDTAAPVVEDRFGEDLDLAAAAAAFDSPADVTATSHKPLRYGPDGWMPASEPMPPLADPAPALAPPPALSDVSRPSRPSLEEGLEQADYLAQQGFIAEARAVLSGLLARSPSHPLITARLQDLDALEHSLAVREGTARAAIPDEFADDLGDFADTGGTDVQPLPSEFNPPAPSERSLVVRIDPATLQQESREGGAMLQAEDFETHYDLGIAYKEMGLLDDAIAEFRIVMRDPDREVLCHMMVGLCFLEKGRVSDAISQFKSGLYATGIQEREELALYYELGHAYERLGDSREALYYYEKVLKRDPQFRDVDRRITTLRGGSNSDATLPPPNDDIDDAFAGLVSSDGK